jgi:hypothetical protein
VIGRKGATIASLQSSSSANFRVSHGGDYFPGTEDRIVVIKGTAKNLQDGMRLMFTELYSESDSWKQQAATLGIGADVPILINLVVPEAAIGLIIGKGGEHIRRMEDTSHAKIQFLPKDKQVPGLPERLLTIQGTLNQIIMASVQIVDRLAADPKCVFQNLTPEYKGFGPGVLHGYMPPLGHNSGEYQDAMRPMAMAPPYGRRYSSEVRPGAGMREPVPFRDTPSFREPPLPPRYREPMMPYREHQPAFYRDAGPPRATDSYKAAPAFPPSHGMPPSNSSSYGQSASTTSASFTLHVPGRVSLLCDAACPLADLPSRGLRCLVSYVL